MIFSHTLKTVISGEKTQSSRQWKENYVWDIENAGFVQVRGVQQYLGAIVRSKLTGRALYEVGQTLAIQPARGKKSIGRIEITSLAKRSVIDFTEDDIRREGFGQDVTSFHLTWLEMHNPSAYRAAHLLSSRRQVQARIDEGLKTCDMALVIGFKLVEVY